MRRRVLAAAVPVAAVAFAWASLEIDPSERAFVMLGAAALLPALPRLLVFRLAAAAAVLIVLAAALAGTTWGAIREVTGRGFRDFYAVVLPFDGRPHPEMHVLVVLAAALFCVAIAVTADRRPFVAAAMVAAGVGWPATILPARNTIAMGALGLFAAAWPLVVARSRDRRESLPGTAALAGIVLVAAICAAAGARPSTAALDWENWDLFGSSRAGQTVALVWSSSYSGIDFPATKTTVLHIEAPRRALYWRATTLDTFEGDRWVEALYRKGDAGGEYTLPPDNLLPVAASSEQDWVEQRVEVRALLDDHVVAASQPMKLAAGSDTRVVYLSGGVMRARDGGEQLRDYTVWSYAPRPSPASLVRSPPTYPIELERYLDVGRTIVPRFGAVGRSAAIAAVFDNDLYQQLWSYEGLWREAERLTTKARSPYEATVVIERWFRSDGGFTYDEHPPHAAGLPPLADFLQRSKHGYCQQFAGAMALMLRYLGIPSRVAVGFTSGTWKDGAWTVTDHDAHAWVEAWFAGYGWLAFDPTPGRGTLSATYTNASDSAEAIRALGSGRFPGFGSVAPAPPSAGVAADPQPTSGDVPWQAITPLFVVLGALVALAAAKAVHRRRRYVNADPRQRASAARAELVGFIRDQGSPLAATASVGEIGVELRKRGVGSDAFAAAFSRARYGPPSVAAEGAEDARRELRRVLGILRTRLGPGRRIRGFLAVRSLRSG